MRQVEALPADASGALLVGAAAHPMGMILVERNRVCWAAALHTRRRLHDLLRQHCTLPLDDAGLERLYARCRHEHRPLGETLVAEGLVSAEKMRAALKQHTAESLLALDQACAHDASELPLTWAPRASSGYNPRYTFTAAEVLAALGAPALDDVTGELVADHLDTLVDSSAAVIAFSTDAEGAPLLVGAQASVWLPLQELLELMAWASAALEASPGFSSAAAHACAHRADGGAVAWLLEGQRWAALCPTGRSLQRLVATLDNQSLAMVLATKLTVLERVRERGALTTPR